MIFFVLLSHLCSIIERNHGRNIFDDSIMRSQGEHLDPISFIVMQFSVKMLPNNRLVLPPGLLSPSGKSWNHNYYIVNVLNAITGRGGRQSTILSETKHFRNLNGGEGGLNQSFKLVILESLWQYIVELNIYLLYILTLLIISI